MKDKTSITENKIIISSLCLLLVVTVLVSLIGVPTGTENNRTSLNDSVSLSSSSETTSYQTNESVDEQPQRQENRQTTVENTASIPPEYNSSIHITKWDRHNNIAEIRIYHSLNTTIQSTHIRTDIHQSMELLTHQIQSENNTVVSVFRVNGGKEETMFTDKVTSNRISLSGPDHIVTIQTKTKEYHLSTDMIYEQATANINLSSAPSGTAVSSQELLYVKPNKYTTTNINTGNQNSTARIIAPENPGHNETYIQQIISTGEQFIDETPNDKPNTNLDIIVATMNDDTPLNGIALDRDDRNTTIVINQSVAQQGRHTTPHEWVHTIQDYTMSNKTEWWIEGSATYMAALLDDNLSSTTSDAKFGKTSYNNGTLNDPRTWADSSLQTMQYGRGASLSYLLDLAIRDHTNGSKSIFDFHFSLTQYDGEITQQVFINHLRRLGGNKTVDIYTEYVSATYNFHVGEVVHNEGLYTDQVANRFTYTVTLPENALLSAQTG